METIAVAVSGGVDSLMAAWMLKQEGKNVFGLHFLTGYESGESVPVADYIREVISIPVMTVDLREAFQSRVVDYFVNAYRAGRTPNPCLICNPSIKFGVLLDKALQMGAGRLATGHYARAVKDSNGKPRLLTGLDAQKDQSYFLAFLTPIMLERACFPLGSATKPDVLRKAAKNGLKSHRPSESQDVCFIRNQPYSEFLESQPNFKRLPGLIETVNGDVIGKHGGLHLFTVGQRKGVNCPAERPYYVIRLDTRRNRLIVGFKEHLKVSAFRAAHVNWILPAPEKPFDAHVRVRYRSEPVPAKIRPASDGWASVVFSAPQRAVTPGQGAVFYQGEEVLGGGVIVDPV